MLCRNLAPIFILACACSGTLRADNLLHPGALLLDRPTLTALGVQLRITGDDNFNASVTVRFRISGAVAWKTALPLFRVHPETVAGWTAPPQFAGSLFDLRPATSYDIELHATDPDGVDQILTITAATRDVPRDPLTPAVRNVVNASTLQSALDSAQPGDVITLADGVYSGQFAIFRAGTPSNPIVIRGASQNGAILDGGNCVGCNVFEVYGAGYVYLERMTIRNAERAIRFQTAGAVGNVVRRVRVQNTRLGIGGRDGQLDFYIADNILEGRLAWPHVYTDDGGIYSDDTGIAVFGFGHVVTHNRISGYGDAMKTAQDGARANDFTGNDVLFSYDNGIELDGSEGNTRSLRNRFMNTTSPLSVQPVHGGPAYLLRNVSVNIVDEQIKFHALGRVPPQEPSGVLAYHNTFVTPSNVALQVQTPYASHYFEIANNLFVARASAGQQVVDWSAPIDRGLFDYNGYFPDGIFRYNIPALGGYFFAPTFASLQGLGLEQHGLIVNGPIFANGMTAPASYLLPVSPSDATLAAGSLALDRGRILPNLNDGFRGSAPDLGALELGCPNPSYGPRPEGTDERNEVIGCDPGTSVTAVQVSPATVTLAALQTKAFTASTNPPGGSVTWQINPARGSVTAQGLYSAPADALLGEQVTITAWSVSDPSVTGSASISLTAPVSVAITPSVASVFAGGTRQFTATVSGAVNKNVHWVLNPAVGAISSSGLYTAPLSISTSQAVGVTAVSDADATKFASASVTLMPDPTPAFAPPAGTYGAPTLVTIGTATPGASIRYTTDGSTPSQTAGTLYTGPVTVSVSLTLKAIAYKSGMPDSAVASAVYTIGGGGGGLSVLWGGNSVGSATLDSAFASLTSWRAEARFHNIVARGAQEAQYNQFSWQITDAATGAIKAVVYLTANAQALILAQGGNYCVASIGGITDLYWRVQYNGSAISYQVWNKATGQAITSVNCSAVTGGMNLTGVMTLGGTSYNSENYKGAMAFLRFYNSVAPNFPARPVDSAPGGEMIKYEFETAANLGADTSGNARSLVLSGAPSSISTPASGGADTIPPTVSITSPAANQQVSGTVALTATASDNAGVTSVQFKLDGSNLGLPVTTAPYSLSWDTTTVSAGSHTLTALASDAAGNSTLSTAVQVQVQGTGGGLSVLWGGNSVGNATLDSAFASLTSWRAEGRFHNIVPRSSQEAQSNQFAWQVSDANTGALKVTVYMTANAQALILAHGGNYCVASIGGITDLYWRVQYNGSVISYQVWKTATGQTVTSVNCSTASGAMNLTGVMTLGGTSYNTENYKGAMAFVRFYNSAAPNFPAAPPDSSSGGEMVRYEFETASNLGADTSGNARTLVLRGTPGSISTPAH